MNCRVLLLAALCAGMGAVTHAAGATAAGERPIVIEHATVHTLDARGTLVDASVVVRGGRIVAIDRAAAVQVPRDAQRIDARGLQVTPGLVDSFTALGLEEVAGVGSSVDVRTSAWGLGPAFDVRPAFDPHSERHTSARLGGVTHALISPLPGSDPFAGSAWLAQLGSPPVLQGTRRALVGVLGRQAAEAGGGSRAAALQRMRAGLVRARAGTTRVAPNDTLSYAPADIEVLAQVLRDRVPLLLAASRAADIRQAMLLAADFDLPLVIVGGEEAWQVAAELAAGDVAVLLDPLANLPASFDQRGARLDNAALLAAAGVRILFSSTRTRDVHRLRQLAGNAAAHGLPREAALAAITRAPADQWRLPPGSGRLRAGGPATLVLWNGDPLELTSWALRVMVDGRWQDLDSRQRRLEQRYRHHDDPRPYAHRSGDTPSD